MLRSDTLHRFARDQRGIELDYMLSLLIFVISLAFTFTVLAQYLDAKHSEVDEVQERLGSIRVLDELTGSAGSMGGRGDWEAYASQLDLQEKINDQTFLLGLRKSDGYNSKNIVIPGASDFLMQTATGATISDAVESLRERGVIFVELAEPLTAIISVDTSTTNPSIQITGSTDGAVTHTGLLFAGSDLDIWVTDTRDDGLLHYDSIVVREEVVKEGASVSVGDRSFAIYAINQEEVLLVVDILEGYVAPVLDQYHYDLAADLLGRAGIKFHPYDDLLRGGSSSLDYTLYSRQWDKFAGQVKDLSIKKITSLRDDIPYEVAKAALGIKGDLNVRIASKRGGVVLLDYGRVAPVDAETVEREVNVEGTLCTMTVSVW